MRSERNGVRALFAWLGRRTDPGAQAGGKRPKAPAAHDIYFTEARDAIEGAVITVRESGEDGPRVAVISRALRGGFIYSPEEATRRLGLAFPELSAEGTRRAVRQLEGRIRAHARPPSVPRRSSWAHGWRDDCRDE